MANEKKGQGAAKAKAPARPRAKKAATPAAEASVASPVSPTTQQEHISLEEQIRRRAHEISKTRNGHGTPEQDWLQAEHEILGKRSN